MTTDPMLDGITRCHVCGDEIKDWGFGTWHHVPSPDEDAYLKGHDHDAVGNTTGSLRKCACCGMPVFRFRPCRYCVLFGVRRAL